MSEQIDDRSLQYARAIARLVTQLPVERAAEVYDFARFLETTTGSLPAVDRAEGDWLIDDEEQMVAEDELWESAFARHRDVFHSLAEAARTEIAAGVTQPMFDEQGEIRTGELAPVPRVSGLRVK